MKKFLLLFCFCVALSASADTFMTYDSTPMKVPRIIQHENQDNQFFTSASKGYRQFIPRFTSVYEERPAGQMKAYERTGGAIGYDPYTGGVTTYSQVGMKAYIVYGENGKVYLMDPISVVGAHSWVEGFMSDDSTQIIVPMGQSIYDAGDGYSIDLCWGSTHYEPSEEYGIVKVIFTIDERVTEAVYTIEGDCLYLEGTEGNIDADFPENVVMTGLSAINSDTKEWAYCIDYGTVYTECPVVEPLPVITKQPEGELREYFRYGECISGFTLHQQAFKAYVVYGDNGKVYLRDPLFGLKPSIGYWVEGTLSEDSTTITVPMNQCFYWNYNEQYGLILKNLTIDVVDPKTGAITVTINEDVTEMTYTIDGNTISLNDTYGSIHNPSQLRGLGCVWHHDYSFGGYLDWKTSYDRIVPTIPSDPSLDEAETGVQNAWRDLGEDGGVLYHNINLKDVNGNRIDEDKLTYSIFTDDNEPFLFTTLDYDFDEYYPDRLEDTYELPYNTYTDHLNPSYTYVYRTNAEGYGPLFNRRIGIQVYYTVDGVRNASHIVYYNIVPEYADGVPENPTADEWYDCGNESGYSKFYYTISKYTTDGETMDPSRIYYSIFTDDDQLFTFRADQYTHDLDEDMTMIPYNLILNGGYDFHKNFNYFYRTNAEGYEPFFNHQIGIQVYYLCENGELTASDIVYLEVFDYDTDVNEVIVSKSVAGVKYYNMAGQEMLEANGICIAVITYTDGTTSTIKLMK